MREYLVIDMVMGGSYKYVGKEIKKLKALADISEILLFNLTFQTVYVNFEWKPLKKIDRISKFR